MVPWSAFFNHFSVAHILLYLSRLSLARKAPREGEESIHLCNIKTILLSCLEEKQWVVRPSAVTHKYQETRRPFRSHDGACNSTTVDNGRNVRFCTSHGIRRASKMKLKCS